MAIRRIPGGLDKNTFANCATGRKQEAEVKADKYFRLPPEMAALRDLKQKLPALSDPMQLSFEYGGAVMPSPFEHKTDEYMYCWLPSGARTVNIRPSNKEEYKMYLEWVEEQGMRAIPVEESLKHIEAIADRLRSLGIKFMFGPREQREASDFHKLTRYGEAWRIVDEVLSVLPDKLLTNGQLKAINFFSERLESSYLSAYDNGSVYIYSGAMKGSRCKLIAKLLHELGHSTIHSLDPDRDKRLEKAHAELKTDKNHMIGLDAMGKPERRKSYQRNFSEFMAEMHLIYVCAGPLLREKIASFDKMSPARKAWEYIYSFFRDEVFDGREYA